MTTLRDAAQVLLRVHGYVDCGRPTCDHAACSLIRTLKESEEIAAAQGMEVQRLVRLCHQGVAEVEYLFRRLAKRTGVTLIGDDPEPAPVEPEETRRPTQRKP